jgi:hypothetical protein
VGIRASRSDIKSDCRAGIGSERSATYASMLRASNWLLEPLLATVKLLRKLTGILELPGMIGAALAEDILWYGLRSLESGQLLNVWRSGGTSEYMSVDDPCTPDSRTEALDSPQAPPPRAGGIERRRV